MADEQTAEHTWDPSRPGPLPPIPGRYSPADAASLPVELDQAGADDATEEDERG